MAKVTHYMFRTRADGGYEAAKMSPTGDPLGIYKITPDRKHCNCPASVHCRHLKMLESFIVHKRVDTGWIMAYETGEWLPPKPIAVKGGLYEDLDELFNETPTSTPHLIDI